MGSLVAVEFLTYGNAPKGRYPISSPVLIRSMIKFKCMYVVILHSWLANASYGHKTIVQDQVVLRAVF